MALIPPFIQTGGTVEVNKNDSLILKTFVMHYVCTNTSKFPSKNIIVVI